MELQEACPDCGALVPVFDGPTHPYIGGSAGCWKLYGEILAREYESPEYMAVHRLTVDAYAAQHPGQPSRQAAQSVTLHLIALYLSMEARHPAESVTHSLGKIAGRRIDWAWLTPPQNMGSIVVPDILSASTSKEHGEWVRKWAASVWAAWSTHHEKIRELARTFA